MTSGGDLLDRQLQPHLTATSGHPAPGLDNPALELDDEDVRVNVGGETPAGSAAASPNPAWEHFDDEGDDSTRVQNRGGASVTQNWTNFYKTGNGGSMSGGETNGTFPAASSHSPPAYSQQQQNATTTAAAQQPVLYNSRSGEAVVVTGDVTSRGGSGVVIETQQIPERWREQERPLRARQMKILKVLSVVAAVLFFPSGIPAAYYAWRTKREFDEGILRGNIDRAQKFARRTERLLILSAILVVLTAVLVFALVEREAYGYSADRNYVAHPSAHG